MGTHVFRVSVPVLYVAALAVPVVAQPLAEAEGPSKALSAYDIAFEARRGALLDAFAYSGQTSIYNQLTRLDRGRPVDEAAIRETLAFVDARRDTADFRTPGLLWLLYRYRDDPGMPRALAEAIETTLLNFKYWPDEGGADDMIAYTENHYILFTASGFLAGQLFPDETFTNSGFSGAEQMARHRARLMKWMDLRFRAGFSEWLSNIYYEETISGLLVLAELSDDVEIAQRASMVLDLLGLDMALNSRNGFMASTHGRSSDAQQKTPTRDRTRLSQWLLFGTGALSGNASRSAALLALASRYRMPEVIADIATDDSPELINRQRMSINVEEAERWGLSYTDPEDGHLWLTINAFVHPLTIELFYDMMNTYNWWENEMFVYFIDERDFIETAAAAGALPLAVKPFEADIQRLLTEVNIFTYRTPDYQLSSAVDFRPGYGGIQQFIWQASLDGEATVFATHPGRIVGGRPGYWEGNGWQPRVMQQNNVVIAIYNAEEKPSMFVGATPDFTHAWFPRDAFDEVREQDHWIFGRTGSGYVALHTQNDYSFQAEPGETLIREIVVPGRQNVYVCEMGREAVDGSFDAFVARVLAAPLRFDGLSVAYESPSQGVLAFEWASEVDASGTTPSPPDFPRYDNRFVQASFPSDRVFVDSGKNTLFLDWTSATRSTRVRPSAQ